MARRWAEGAAASDVVVPLDAARAWRRLRLFGVTVDAGSAGTAIDLWQRGIADIARDPSAESRVASALDHADDCGLGQAIARWMAQALTPAPAPPTNTGEPMTTTFADAADDEQADDGELTVEDHLNALRHTPPDRRAVVDNDSTVLEHLTHIQRRPS